jgi:predicted metal-dependent peptidase
MTAPAVSTHDARLRVMAARVIAQQRWPYVANLLFNFKLVETPHDRLPTMAVDSGWRLYYSPVFVMEQTPEALATVLLHESLHCLHDHSDRFTSLNRPGSEHPVWNFAGDAAINEVLDAERMPWPTVSPVRYADLERYGVEHGATTEKAFFAIIDYRDNHPEEFAAPDDCGSVSGGASRPYELPPSDRDAPGMRSDHQDLIRDRVAHDIIKHAKGRGSVPGDLLRWAELLLNPRVDWREALASRVRREIASVAGRRDYVYTRPSRRQEAMRVAGSNLVLPAMRQPAPPRVACVIDTSGSIAGDELRDFVGEVVGITRASGVAAGVTVLACDAEARAPQQVRSRADAEHLRLEGGGGTDMGAGIAAAAELRPRPHIIVVFTDGYTPWPDRPPRRIDSVIVVLSSESQRADVPGWAQVIMLES